MRRDPTKKHRLDGQTVRLKQFLDIIATADNGRSDGSNRVTVSDDTTISMNAGALLYEEFKLTGDAAKAIRAAAVEATDLIIPQYRDDERRRIHSSRGEVSTERSRIDANSHRYLLAARLGQITAKQLQTDHPVSFNKYRKRWRPKKSPYHRIDSSDRTFFRNLDEHYHRSDYARWVDHAMQVGADFNTHHSFEIQEKESATILDNLYAAIQFANLDYMQLPHPTSGQSFNAKQLQQAIVKIQLELAQIDAAKAYYDALKDPEKQNSWRQTTLQKQRDIIERIQRGGKELLAQYTALSQQLLSSEDPRHASTRFNVDTMRHVRERPLSDWVNIAKHIDIALSKVCAPEPSAPPLVTPLPDESKVVTGTAIPERPPAVSPTYVAAKESTAKEAVAAPPPTTTTIASAPAMPPPSAPMVSAPIALFSGEPTPVTAAASEVSAVATDRSVQQLYRIFNNPAMQVPAPQAETEAQVQTESVPKRTAVLAS